MPTLRFAGVSPRVAGCLPSRSQAPTQSITKWSLQTVQIKGIKLSDRTGEQIYYHSRDSAHDLGALISYSRKHSRTLLIIEGCGEGWQAVRSTGGGEGGPHLAGLSGQSGKNITGQEKNASFLGKYEYFETILTVFLNPNFHLTMKISQNYLLH